MATNVVFNGVTYSVPAVNEEDWQSLSNYLIALASASPSGGAVSSNIRVSTSATTAVATSDYAVAINYSSGAATVNLPAGVAKQIFIITDASGTAATNNITINRNGTNTIFGDTSYVLTHNNQSVIIGFSGGNWYRLAESIPGAVEGPASSVVGGVAAFNNTTGDRLQDLGVGTSGQVLKTDGTTPFFGMIVNANVDPTAAIAYSKLALTNSIVNADISSGAAIAYSKLNLTGTIVNADINASAAIAYSKLDLTASIRNTDIFGAAAIAYSKLNLSGSIVNADVNAAAGIVYSKLNLTGGIVNADVNASAAITYSKLNLVGGIVNADINASAAIARSKIAAGSASHVVVNDGSGLLSSVATLPVSQGGTGLNTLGSALQVLRVDSLGTSLEFATLAAGSGDVVGPASSVTNGIVQFASTTGKALKDLGVGTANTVLRTDGTTPNFGTITNAYIDASAAISYSKMESLTALKALITNGSGALITHPNTTADEIGYLFGTSSNIQIQLNAKLNLSGGTLTGALTINTASNQLVLGSGVNALTVNGGTSAAARTYTVPDVGTTADFVLTAGAQTIAGAKTFSSLLSATAGANITGGNVGIGTSSPDAKLTLNDPGQTVGITFKENGTTRARLQYDGTIPGVTLTVSGTSTEAFRATSTGSVTLGPTTDDTASSFHTTYKNIFTGTPSAATQFFGSLYIGSNAYLASGAQPTRITGLTGSVIKMFTRTADNTTTFAIATNIAADGATGVSLDKFSITAAGAVTLGPTTNFPYDGFHTTYNNIASGTPSVATDLNGMWAIAANAFWATNYLPTRLTGLTGPRIGLQPRTSDTTESIVFVCNQAADSATTGGDVIGSATAAGAWTFPLIHNIGAGNITSGRYTPTLTSVANIASANAQSSHYSRVGNTVTVAIWLSPISATAAASTVTRIRISLPIASNFTSQTDAQGTANFFRAAATAAEAPGVVLANVAGDDLEIYWLASTTSAGDVLITAQYEVK